MVSSIGELNSIIKGLWDKNPQWFYAYPGNSKKVSTKNDLGLFKYLTKYLDSAPIIVLRITCVREGYVSYYYQSYISKHGEYECVEAEVFIDRMVQHIMSKGF